MVYRSGQELAYRYDHYIVPVWREQFDAIVEKHVALPKEGSILEVNSGTGSLALELALKMGERGEVLATDQSAERLAIAKKKASAKRVGNITFLQKDPINLGLDENSFSLAIGDATLSHPSAL
ncbi:MAG: class I SAM-dependent methyltransferase, partial [candidate division WOR-3 bacterium]